MKTLYSHDASGAFRRAIRKYQQWCTSMNPGGYLPLTILVAAIIVSPLPAEAQECEQLQAAACVESLDCMYKKAGDKFEYDCIAASNRCQTGFVQSSDERIMLCESQQGCSFIPAG